MEKRRRCTIAGITVQCSTLSVYTPLAKDSTNINDDDGKYIMNNDDDDDAKTYQSAAGLFPLFWRFPEKLVRLGHGAVTYTRIDILCTYISIDV